jgi:3-oxoadipate enol-lactonase/4-carboxymuconolactone decarboxylase
MEIRREVLGADHVEAVMDRTTTFNRDFQEIITGFAWGDVWSRPGLDRRTRSCIALTALVAMGRLNELELHIAAARRNGLAPNEIAEVLIQCAVYCGVPAANAAFRVAQQVLGEE